MSDDPDVREFELKLRKSARTYEALGSIVLLIATILGVGILIVGLVVMEPGDTTGLRVVGEAGFTEPRIIDKGGITFRCSRDDVYHYYIEAKNPSGDKVTVTVCCGLFKDCTVRYQ